MPTIPYNPLDKNSIGDNIVRELVARPILALPPPKSKGRVLPPKEDVFEGAGIYALYYVGDFPAYARIAVDNGEERFDTPIHIGKADPKGGRKGALELDSAVGTPLYNRLKDHASSIEQAINLQLPHFFCRFLVVDDTWISLGERRAIQKYLPLWNTTVDGFGNHDPGNRRKEQYRSDWDVVHPGRSWAEKLPGRSWAEKLGRNPKTIEQILAAVLHPPTAEQLEQMAAEALQAETEA